MINLLSSKFVSFEQQFSFTPYLYSILGNCCIGIMQCATRFIGQVISTNLILCIRAIVLMVINTLVIVSTGGPIYIRRGKALLLVSLRTFLSSVGLFLNFYCIQFVSLSIINAVWMTSPIWTHFIEAIFLKTRLGISNVVIALFCFVGILLITKPQFLFGKSSNDMLYYYCFLTLIGSMCTSVSLIMIRELRKQISNLQNLQHFYYGQIMLNAVSVLIQGDKASQVKQINPMTFVWLGVLVVSAYTAQISITRSLYLKSASEVGLFSYALIVVTLVIDIFVFGQVMDLLSFLGVLVILSSLFVVITKGG